MNENAARRAHPLWTLVVLPEGFSRLAALVLGILLLWFSAPTIASLHPFWSKSVNYSHGYLVLGLTGLLVSLEMRRAPLAPFVPSWAGFWCSLVLVLAMWAGHASTTVLVAQLALPTLWMTAVWTYAGARNARRVVPPLAYLYAAIPFWDLFIEPLRKLTILVVSVWIRAAGLPAFIEGNLIHVPSGTFEVQGGCAGLRYVMIASALAAFGGLLNHRRWVPTALLTLLALALALVGNWVRVFITVAVGQSSEIASLSVVRDHHTFFGWAMFVVFMVPLFFLDRMLQARKPVAPTAGVARDAGTPIAPQYAVNYVFCAVLALAAWLTYRVTHSDESPDATWAIEVPEIPGWNRTAEWEDMRLPQFVGASAQSASWYLDGPARVGAYVVHYGTQWQEHEIVFSSNLPAGKAAVVIARQTVMVEGSGFTTPFQELEVSDSSAERRLVWVALRVAGRLASSNLIAKVWQIDGAVRGRRDAQALVLTAMCEDDCSKARSWLSRYAMVAVEPLFRQAEQSTHQQLSTDSRGAMQ